MKKCLMVLCIILLWGLGVIILASQYHCFTVNTSEKESIQLLEDINVFVVNKSEGGPSFGEFVKGDIISLWQVSGDNVVIGYNHSYVNLEQTELARVEGGRRNSLSLHDKINLLKSLTRGEQLDIDIQPGYFNEPMYDIEPLYYDYVDLQGAYEGRIVCTEENPSIDKKLTNVDVVLNERQRENQKKSHELHLMDISYTCSPDPPGYIIAAKEQKGCVRKICVRDYLVDCCKYHFKSFPLKSFFGGYVELSELRGAV